MLSFSQNADSTRTTQESQGVIRRPTSFYLSIITGFSIASNQKSFDWDFRLPPLDLIPTICNLFSPLPCLTVPQRRLQAIICQFDLTHISVARAQSYHHQIKQILSTQSKKKPFLII